MKFLFLGEKVEGWGGGQIVANCMNILLLNPWNMKFIGFSLSLIHTFFD